MGHQTLTITVASILTSLSAEAVTMDVQMPILFQNSPAKLGRNLTSENGMRNVSIPSLKFNSALKLNHNGATQIGDRCALSAIHAGEGLDQGYFNSPLTHSPGGKIVAGTTYEMRLISYGEEILKIELRNLKAESKKLELTCTHPKIQNWTVAQFEAHLEHKVKIHAPDSLRSSKSKSDLNTEPSLALNDLKGSSYNGWFGSGLPGTAGIQLLFGANLKAYAEETNATIVSGKRCRLVSQENQALSNHYLKGSKFAFREYRSVPHSKQVELVFDNWNQSPHQVRVQCRGELASVKKMTLAEVEHDLNGTVQFYQKKAL